MSRNWRLAQRLRLAALPLLVIIALFVAWRLGYFELDRRRQLVSTVEHVRQLPAALPLYVAGYAVAVSLVLPAALATLLAGAVFGPIVGALVSWVGALGATLLGHSVARSVARRPLQRLFGEHRFLRTLRDHDSVMVLFRLRILPVAPFGVLNYVAGIADVSLWRLLVATALGILPSVLAYSYAGAELLRGIASSDETSRGALVVALGISAIMVTLSLAPRLVQRLRR